MQNIPDDAAKEARLKAAKRRATGLLILTAGIFIAARALRGQYPWLDLVRATAEAAMIGGLADWFAVTALFRHPLRIPIPHTAIVPRRKDQVGRALGTFVQRNFLTRDVLEARLRRVRPAERLGEWMAAPENARTVARHAAGALAAAANMVRDEDVEALVDRTVAQRMRSVRAAPLVARALTLVTENNRHHELFDEIIRLTARAVEENHEVIRDRVERESPWWIPTAVDERIYQKIVNAIEHTLLEMQDDHTHPVRVRFDAAVREFIKRLDTSPEAAARVEALKEELFDTEGARRLSLSLWGEAKDALSRYSQDLEERAPGAVEDALTLFGRKVLEDPELAARVDDFLVDLVAFLAQRYQDEVADLIAHTVQSWDPDVTTRRVELAIGRDLQFIRINGTLVGGLVGLVIYLVSHALPG